MASATQRIMSLEALQSGRITHASQDGSREFISFLACVSATGVVLPPALTYKGDSGALQDTWIEDWVSKDEAFFVVSSKGWSCDAIGLNWLKQVFERYTAPKTKGRRRLLIVDGHSSYVNMKFINLCDQLRILLLVLPSHSTHRLQPLDVSLFASLASYYTDGLNQLLNQEFRYGKYDQTCLLEYFSACLEASFHSKKYRLRIRKNWYISVQSTSFTRYNY